MKAIHIAAISGDGHQHQGHDSYKYGSVPIPTQMERDSKAPSEGSDEEHQTLLKDDLRSINARPRGLVIWSGMGAVGLILLLWLAVGYTKASNKSCDTVDRGFTCSPNISRYWGQYSPYFSVPSEISTDLPDQCQITFAQVLSRHGARDPTFSKTINYGQLIDRIHSDVTDYSKSYAFIKDYSYTLGADQLSIFGQQQMINSGVKFYDRYRSLARASIPFIRSSGQDRVIESAQNWTQGFHLARTKHSRVKDMYPYNIIVIPEKNGINNTLDHGLCTAFEEGPDSTIAANAQAEFMAIFTPNITTRLNDNLPGANITNTDTIFMMDLCPFNTVASTRGTLSPFCALFTEQEWKAYDYFQTLGKYYGYSYGNPLGPTQGVGFTNELIARLTNTSVQDHTSTNSTMDSNLTTFGRATLYADFSHDNDLTSIFAALGLYNSTTAPLLSNSSITSASETGGYSAAWTVPFAARLYVEKMQCDGEREEYVRVIVNDRVIPLEGCGVDRLGRCKLGAYVESLGFARGGGEWTSCFV